MIEFLLILFFCTVLIRKFSNNKYFLNKKELIIFLNIYIINHLINYEFAKEIFVTISIVSIFGFFIKNKYFIVSEFVFLILSSIYLSGLKSLFFFHILLFGIISYDIKSLVEILGIYYKRYPELLLIMDKKEYFINLNQEEPELKLEIFNFLLKEGKESLILFWLDMFKDKEEFKFIKDSTRYYISGEELKMKVYFIKDFFNDKDSIYLSLIDDVAFKRIFNQEIRIKEIDDLSNYIIEKEDFSRNNLVDKLFLKKYKMKLLDLFDNKSVSGWSDEEIEIDHFFVPKSKGGNFLMKRRDGYIVLNAVPLTKSENSSKGNRYWKKYFKKDQREDILNKLKQLEAYINEDIKRNKIII